MASQILRCVAAVLLLTSCSNTAARRPGSSADRPNAYDLVLSGGRVMDPESGLDGVRNVGIKDGTIRALSEGALSARETLDVRGLIVAPGFIDLHAHGQDNKSNAFQARDGVTTALDLEAGAYPVDMFFANRRDKAILHYGVATGHIPARINVSTGLSPGHPMTREVYLPWYMKFAEKAYAFFADTNPMASLQDPLSESQVEELLEKVDNDLVDGGVGVGFGLDYTPGADDDEIRRVFEVVAKRGVPCFVHMKGVSGLTDMSAMESLLGYAESSGAALHVLHITSMGQKRTPRYLEMIEAARERGMDVTVEAYPYTAGSTYIESAFFDDGWRARLGIDYGDLQWSETGERLTEEIFHTYREQGGLVILHAMTPEIVELAIAHPLVMIASDGVPMLKGGEHPRGAGTYARVLGYYSRELGTIDLMDALRKMTIMPAQRLEAFVPEMRDKGRIRIGADADITVFDPATVIDRATFEDSHQASEGIPHVLVAGTFVVRDGVLVPNVYPGQPIRAPRSSR